MAVSTFTLKNYWVGDPQDLQHYQPTCPTETPPEISDITWQNFANYPGKGNGSAFDGATFYSCTDKDYQYTIICWGSFMGSTWHVMRMPIDPDKFAK